MAQKAIKEGERNASIFTNDPEAKRLHNTIKINLAKGATQGFQTIKNELKERYSCVYNDILKKWICPIESQEEVNKLLKEKEIKSTIETFFFDYNFKKSKLLKKADNLWTQIIIKEEQYNSEEIKIRGDESQVRAEERDLCKKSFKLSFEIEKRNLSEDDPEIIELKQNIEKEQKIINEKLKLVDERYEKNKEVKEEIEQLRNSARLLEEGEKEENQTTFSVQEELKKLADDLLEKEEPCDCFSIEALPEILKDYIASICESTNAHPIMITAAVLAAISSFLKKSAYVEGYFQTLYPNLWMLNITKSGQFKSTSLNKGAGLAWEKSNQVISKIREHEKIAIRSG